MRAIDLYAGIGGWSLGLRLSGIDVVASYEWWKPAVDTHNANHGGKLVPTNVRQLDLETLPANIDLVVGSPPCTEFSYANRGGNGDLPEGMKDLARFFEIVEHVGPRFWMMENVPRVASVLREAAKDKDHVLHPYSSLFPVVEVVDFSDFGTPQARKRCIAGNVPRELLLSYSGLLPKVTLGDVVRSLSAPSVSDPLWGVTLPLDSVTERQIEHHLGDEELRMNREAKSYHPVYNNMAFPDDLKAVARTVTATCTRVSRESIIILDPQPNGGYRRLNIRERASLQGFPITYQFYGRSFGEKAKMVGNAIPPTFTYLIGKAVQNCPPEKLGRFGDAQAALRLPETEAPVTDPEGRGYTYPKARSFRAALPGLRFKSGMRFELANSRTGDEGAVAWSVRFFYGASKDIQEVSLDSGLLANLNAELPFAAASLEALNSTFDVGNKRLAVSSPADLQSVWSRRGKGIGPFELVDLLGALAERVFEALQTSASPSDLTDATNYVVEAARHGNGEGFAGRSKLEQNALRVLSGFVVGRWFNSLEWHHRQQPAKKPRGLSPKSARKRAATSSKSSSPTSQKV